VDDLYTVNEDVFWVLLDVMDNDSYLPDPFEVLSVAEVSLPDGGGSAVISGTRILYSPAPDFFGTETFTYTLSDGELTDTAMVVINVVNSNDAPELTDLDISPEPLLEGQELTFTATVNDPGFVGLDFEIRWDFDDGTIVTGTLTPTHTYLDDGLYNLTIVLTDTLGASNQYMIPLDVENVAPEVDVSGGDVTAEINQVLTFSGSYFDPGADTHTIVWDFGDGITTTGSLTVDHAYESAGLYNVALTVTDDEGGVGVDEVEVEVQSAYIYLPIVIKVGGSSANGPSASSITGPILKQHMLANVRLTPWHELLLPDGRKWWPGFF
jgi:hypothetical protein